MISTCHNCRIGPSEACLACRRADYDDIRIQHSPHNRAELQAAVARTAGEQATVLPADVEDRLRRFLFDLFDLSPVQLLMLRHVKHGGTPNSFGRVFAAFVKASITYGDRRQRERWERTCEEIGAHVSRATAWAIWDGMVKAHPLLAVFRTWGRGHGGREALADDPDGRCVQGEFSFCGRQSARQGTVGRLAPTPIGRD